MQLLRSLVLTHGAVYLGSHLVLKFFRPASGAAARMSGRSSDRAPGRWDQSRRPDGQAMHCNARQ